MSSLIGCVGPNSIVSTNHVLPTLTSEGAATRNSDGVSLPVARKSGRAGKPSERGETEAMTPAGELADHEMWAGGWTRW